LTDEIIETPVLLNESKQYGTEDRVSCSLYQQITFPALVFTALASLVEKLFRSYIC